MTPDKQSPNRQPLAEFQRALDGLSKASAEQQLPVLLVQDDAPVFAEPWQAQVFAMTLQLHQEGVFEWSEWASALAAQIKVAQSQGDPDLGDTYYNHWLAALEQILLDKEVTTELQLEDLRGRWQAAANATPHGQPIVIDESLAVN